MLNLVETSQGFVIVFPTWIGIALLAVGAAVGVAASRGEADATKRWLTFAISLTLLWAGLYAFTAKVTLTDQGIRDYVFMVKDESIEWRDAASFRLVEKQLRAGSVLRIVVRHRSGRKIEISGLSDGERGVVIKFITAKLQQ